MQGFRGTNVQLYAWPDKYVYVYSKIIRTVSLVLKFFFKESKMAASKDGGHTIMHLAKGYHRAYLVSSKIIQIKQQVVQRATVAHLSPMCQGQSAPKPNAAFPPPQ